MPFRKKAVSNHLSAAQQLGVWIKHQRISMSNSTDIRRAGSAQRSDIVSTMSTTVAMAMAMAGIHSPSFPVP